MDSNNLVKNFINSHMKNQTIIDIATNTSIVVQKLSIFGILFSIIKTFFIIFIIYLFIKIMFYFLSGSTEYEHIDNDSKGGIFSTGPSAKSYDLSPSKIKFADVAGLTEAKQEVQIFVDIMKNRQKYLDMGAKLPKGFLMVGPPGCGKTLLAKAIAGEAGVNFIAVNGSEFDEMYVGVGASRVRSLFAKARKNAPCIVFIDEIDGIGSKRGQSHNSEHDKTLNNLLVEMDGFNASEQILCIGATNRLDILDDAIKRSGRFDKHIVVDIPSKENREDLFQLYLKKIKLENMQDVNDYSKQLAKITPGVSGADIDNICNQSAIIAVNENKKNVTLAHLKQAIEDVCIGGQRRSRKVNENEKKIVAYHESGHAILGYVLKNTGAPQIISCIPRGAGNLGYTMPEYDDEMLRSKIKMIEEISALLGGTIAEDIFFDGNVTTGASNDIERATNLAYSMCTQYGMSKSLGKIQMSMEKGRTVSEGLKVSNETMAKVDNVVRKLVDDIYKISKDIMIEYKKEVEKIAIYLIDNEEIRTDKIHELLGTKIYKSKTLNMIEF